MIFNIRVLIVCAFFCIGSSVFAAHAVITKIDLAGVEPDSVESVTLSFGTSAPVVADPVIPSDENDQSAAIFPFSVDTDAGFADGATGTATVTLKNGQVIENAPFEVRDGVIVIDTAAVSLNQGDGNPRISTRAPDTAVQVASGLTIRVGAYVQDSSIDSVAEGATEVVFPVGGSVFDRGLNNIDMSPTLYGYTVGGSYDLQEWGVLDIDFTSADGDRDFTMDAPATGDSTISRGFAFYQNDSTFGTGISFGDVPVMTEGNVDVDYQNIRFSYDLTWLDFAPDGSPYFAYPTVGLEHREFEQTTQFVSTASVTGLGDFWNIESIAIQNDATGPIAGLTFGRDLSHNGKDGRVSVSANVNYMNRDASIRADQSVTGPTGVFAGVNQQIQYDDDGSYVGWNIGARIDCNKFLDGRLAIGLEGGIRSDETLQFTRQSDGQGRGFVPEKERFETTYGGLTLSYRF